MGMFRNSNSFIISRLTIFHQLLRTSVSWTMALKSRLQSLPNKRKISGNSLFFSRKLDIANCVPFGCLPRAECFFGLIDKLPHFGRVFPDGARLQRENC